MNTKRAHIRRDFPDELKIRAVTAMLMHEHPLSRAAMDQAQLVIGHPVKPGTLDRWLKQYQDQIKQTSSLIHRPANISTLVENTRADILSNMQSLMGKLLAAANQDDKIKESSLRDIAVTYGVMFDKVIKIAGLNPDWEDRLHRLEALCASHGDDPFIIFDEFYDEIKQQYKSSSPVIMKSDE